MEVIVMTKNKSLYQILDDNHLIVTEELAKQAKEEILQSLLSLIPKKKISVINPARDHKVWTKEQAYNQAIDEITNSVREWVNRV